MSNDRLPADPSASPATTEALPNTVRERIRAAAIEDYTNLFVAIDKGACEALRIAREQAIPTHTSTGVEIGIILAPALDALLAAIGSGNRSK